MAHVDPGSTVHKDHRTDTVGTNVRSVDSLDRDFLKRPTGWPFKDPYDFMAGKRQDDGVPCHLWRIHDRYYDLSDFKHPGGDQWLSLTKGTDITELFESHHLDMERVKRMLPAFEEPQDEPLFPRHSPFTFEPDGFYCTLRRKVWAQYGGKQRKSAASLGHSVTAQRFADTVLAVSALLTLSAGSSKGPKRAAAIAMANGIINGLFIGIGHNFMHQKDNFRRHYMDLSGFSSSEFRMHHALSHHPYTNTVMDAEMNQLLPAIDFFPGRSSAARARLAKVSLGLIGPLALPLKTIVRFAQMLLRIHPGAKEDYVAQVLPLAQVLALSSLRGSATSGLALWSLMRATTSSLFLWLNFLTGPHFNDECWHQGDTLDSTDWGMMQVQTNTERKDMSRKNTLGANVWNIPTFGLHHLHHLFPTIDAADLSELVPLFEEHCEEWGVTFETMSNSDLAAGLWKVTAGCPPNDRTRNGVYAQSLSRL